MFIASCKKDITYCSRNIQLQEYSISIEDCHDNDSLLTKSAGDNGNVNIGGTIPIVHPYIQELSRNPDFNEDYDFRNYTRTCYNDTAEAFVYVIPPFEYCNSLVVVLDSTGLISQYVFALPFDFNYNYYYDNYFLVPFTVYRDDYSDIAYSGTIDLRELSMNIDYVNENVLLGRRPLTTQELCSLVVGVHSCLWGFAAGVVLTPMVELAVNLALSAGCTVYTTFVCR